jgi:hypothetical protein
VEELELLLMIGNEQPQKHKGEQAGREPERSSKFHIYCAAWLT